LLFLSVLLLANTSCKSDPDRHDRSSKETSIHIKKTIASFGSRPNFSVQVHKGGSRLELIGNGMPLYNIFSKGGFSALIPFNGNILKNGQQQLTIKVYPDQGKDHFDDYARVSVKVMLFRDEKTNIEDGVPLAIFELPKEAIEKKLNFYEATLTFEAEVPFNFGGRLENAKVLKDMPNIDAKVVAAYENIKTWIGKKDLKSLGDFRRSSDEKMCIEFYYDTDKKITEAFDYSFLLEDNKAVNPMPEYKINFYASGKLVRLETVDTKDEVITLTGKTNDGDEVASDLSVLLYMPEGSTELMQY
jgi:hypothetical protein